MFTRTHSKTGSLLGACVLLSVPLLLDCGKMPGGGGLPGGVPGAGGACPADLADASAIMSANFGLEAELEGKVKAALAAGANLQKIAGEIEAEVTTACTNLAKDLGASDADLAPKKQEPGAKAEAACTAAANMIGTLKAKAKGNFKVDIKPPECRASMTAMADCAAKCDVKVKPGEAKVSCEGGKISGECSGKCEGECSAQAGAKCEGSCSGTCDGECSGEISGKCDGTCNGKCDGKDSKGKCAGTCDGKCDGKAKASCSANCKGSCSASCTMKASGKCEGECSGKCDVEMKAPKCSGTVKPPEMSGECKANCDAEVSGKVECTPARVVAKLDGSADVQAATKLKAALEAHLPALLKVSMGMKGRLEGVQASVKSSLEGVQAAVQGGGAAALKVAGCFAASLEAQAQASMSINVSVKASASASGSASGKAG